jgi:hypothetical protein
MDMRLTKVSVALTAPVAACGFFLAGLVVSTALANNGTTITACAQTNNGRLRLVSSPSDCSSNEQAVQWNSEGVQGPQGPPGPQGPAGEGLKTIAGLVNIDGTCPLPAGGGVICGHIQTGEYELKFPAGTWTAFPVIVVTPFGLPGVFPIAEVGNVVGAGDGSAIARILISSSAGPWTPHDASFWFIAVQSGP